MGRHADAVPTPAAYGATENGHGLQCARRKRTTMGDPVEKTTKKLPDLKRADMLKSEIGKVRCWLTGFHAGRGDTLEIPGEDSLRQVQLFLQELICAQR